MVEEALAEGKRSGRGTGTGTENAGQLQVVVLSVRPLLAFCPLAMFFSFSFCFFALLFLFFLLRRAVHLPCKMSGRLSECLDEWLVGTLVSSFNGPQEIKLKLCLRLGEQSKHLQAVRQIN